jgi:hypothetical protein
MTGGGLMSAEVPGGGVVFDGTRAPTAGDVVVEDGRIVEVGAGLDGDELADRLLNVLCSGSSTAMFISWPTAISTRWPAYGHRSR